MRFAVTPPTIPYSTDQVTSIVDLTVTLTNDDTKPVACGQVTFTFPYGDGGGNGDQPITADPSTITTAPGDATPWAVSSDGTGKAYALTLPPVTGLAAGETASFVFGAVIVNATPGPGNIDVAAVVDGTTVNGTVTVDKDRAAQPGDGVPAFVTFTVTPERIAQGTEATITWEVTGATTCVLEPGPTTLVPPDQGTLPVTVWDSTVYRIVALSSRGTARDKAPVTVMPVVIDDFSALHKGQVLPGTEVTLSWATAFAAACSIDQGVGPVRPLDRGTVTVKPMQTTVYTLTASGLNPRSRSVTVAVTGS
jgi:hypothetical protein